MIEWVDGLDPAMKVWVFKRAEALVGLGKRRTVQKRKGNFGFIWAEDQKGRARDSLVTVFQRSSG